MIAAFFPGQGSQHVEMGKFLFNEFSLVRELFEEASDAISVDFKKLCFEGPESELALTENTQPALLLVSTATYQALNSVVDLSIQAGAGHSIGEYAALVTSGSLNFSEAIQAVRKRGQFMQQAVPVGVGGMVAAMGLTPDQAFEACQWASEKSGVGVLEPANFNAPGQIVLSGHQKVIDHLVEHASPEIFKEAPKRMKWIPLKVSAPFHCSLMKPAELQMEKELESKTFSPPSYPIVQNVTARAETNPNDLQQNLIQQISAPVRWVECTETLISQGFTQSIEFGCGQVIKGLVKKISRDLKVQNINSLEDFKAAEALVNG